MVSKRKILNLEMYNCKIVFIISDDLITQVNKLHKKHKIKLKWEDSAEGVTLSPGIDLYYIIIQKEYLTHNTIAHEVFHAVMRVTTERGIEEEEARAWLAGHITSGFYRFLQKMKLEVKNG